MLERGWTSFLMQIILTLKLVGFGKATLSNAKSVFISVSFPGQAYTPCTVKSSLTQYFWSVFSSPKETFLNWEQPSALHSKVKMAAFWFLPALGWIVHVLFVHKFVLSAWAQVCKNTRSSSASRRKKSTRQHSLNWGSQHTLVSTTQSQQHLWVKLQYLLIVTLLCLFSCSSAATEISCGDSPKQLPAS